MPTDAKAERLWRVREAGVEWNGGEQARIQAMKEVSGVYKLGSNTR